MMAGESLPRDTDSIIPPRGSIEAWARRYFCRWPEIADMELQQLDVRQVREGTFV